MRAGVLVPMQEEFAAYPRLLAGLTRCDDGIWERYLSGDGATAIVLCDCGPANAAAAAERLITGWQPDLVINSGSAGAHNPELLPGDIVIGSSYLIHDDPLYPMSFRHLRWRRAGARVEHERLEAPSALVETVLASARHACAGEAPWSEASVWPAGVAARPPRALAGVIGSADLWTTDHARLALLHEQTASECEDMESAYIAQVCAMHDIPFVAVRCISNSELHAGTTGLDVLAPIRQAGALAARVVVDALAGLQALPELREGRA